MKLRGFELPGHPDYKTKALHCLAAWIVLAVTAVVSAIVASSIANVVLMVIVVFFTFFAPLGAWRKQRSSLLFGSVVMSILVPICVILLVVLGVDMHRCSQNPAADGCAHDYKTRDTMGIIQWTVFLATSMVMGIACMQCRKRVDPINEIAVMGPELASMSMRPHFAWGPSDLNLPGHTQPTGGLRPSFLIHSAPGAGATFSSPPVSQMVVPFPRGPGPLPQAGPLGMPLPPHTHAYPHHIVLPGEIPMHRPQPGTYMAPLHSQSTVSQLQHHPPRMLGLRMVAVSDTSSIEGEYFPAAFIAPVSIGGGGNGSSSNGVGGNRGSTHGSAMDNQHQSTNNNATGNTNTNANLGGSSSEAEATATPSIVFISPSADSLSIARKV